MTPQRAAEAFHGESKLKQAFHLALSREDAKQLFGCRDEESLREWIQQFVESDTVWKEQRVVRHVGHWRTLHQCLSDGSLDPDGGEFPLNHVFLGGRKMVNSDSTLVAMIRPDMVPIIADAMASHSREQLQHAFQELVEPVGESAEFEEICNTFDAAQEFFARAAKQQYAAVFAEIE